MKTSKRLLLTVLLLGAALLPLQTFAAAGDLYALDYTNSTLVRITPNGSQTLVASGLPSSFHVAVDDKGVVYLSLVTGEIKKITNGVVTSFATGFGTSADLTFRSGFLFATNAPANTVVRIAPDGTKTNYASGFNDPTNLAFDHDGNLFVCENGYGGNASIISKTTPTGTRTTFAGNLNNAEGLAFDAAGNLFEAETGVGIYKFTPNGTRTLLTSAVYAPRHLAFDSTGNLFVSTPNSDFISKVAPNGAVTQFKSGIKANGIAFEPPLGQPINIATRMRVQTGDNALIAGFIITGSVGKKVLIRGIGPSLASLGITGALSDPIIELRNASGAFVNGNNNWKDTQQAAIAATGAAPIDDRESALIITLGPGAWTVTMRGTSNTTGIGVVEVYDLDQPADSRLANISTRGFVETGNNVMIGGFIVGSGNGAGRVMVRAIGPSLASVGISGALADPVLSLRNANGIEIGYNNDWSFAANGDDSKQKEIQATGLAPSNSKESAIVMDLPNGGYTAIVSGNNGGTGIGLVEVYNLR